MSDENDKVPKGVQKKGYSTEHSLEVVDQIKNKGKERRELGYNPDRMVMTATNEFNRQTSSKPKKVIDTSDNKE